MPQTLKTVYLCSFFNHGNNKSTRTKFDQNLDYAVFMCVICIYIRKLLKDICWYYCVEKDIKTTLASKV